MSRFFAVLFACLFLAFCTPAYAAPYDKTETATVSPNNIPIAVERKNYETLSPPVGPYSHAVKHGNTLYLSGLTAYGTGAQGKSMAEQARAVFSQLKAIAEAEGTDLRSLIKVTVFITDFSQAQALRQELFMQYGGHLPASSLIEVAKLFSPVVNIEIEAILGL